jgi:very-short-patch-repair endonuclease
VTETEAKIFLAFLKQNGVPKPEMEYPFAQSKGRRWRFDFCWPDESLALEVDGGVWTSGRHTRGSGWTKDTEKLNTAASMGWRMLRTTPKQLCTTEMLETIREALAA